MHQYKRRTILCSAASFLLVSSLAAGCSSSMPGKEETKTDVTKKEEKTEQKAGPVISTEPVTLTLFLGVAANDDEVKQYFIEPTQKMYPHIKLDILKPGQGQNVGDLVAAGRTPDIIYFQSNVANLQRFDIPLDLRELMKKFSYSLDILEPGILNTGPDGEVYGVPFGQNGPILWYNKNIFDRFGVAYPKNGTTWEDTIELTRRLTRMDGPVQYYGFHPFHTGITSLGAGLGISVIDSKTDKPIISSKWNDIFKVGMDIFSVPGNKPDTLLNGTQARARFIEEQTLAMIDHQYNEILSSLPVLRENKVDVDMVAHPRYAANQEAKGRNSYTHMVISKSSKYPDQAFQVLRLLLSEQVQLLQARNGRIPMLSSGTIKQQFGQDNPDLKGKNIEALFRTGKLPDKDDPSPYTPIVNQKLNDAFANVYNKGIDINTALRQAEEEANKAIQAEKNK
jgi:multiple sugar transport system substrate-binding protein